MLQAAGNVIHIVCGGFYLRVQTESGADRPDVRPSRQWEAWLVLFISLLSHTGLFRYSRFLILE